MPERFNDGQFGQKPNQGAVDVVDFDDLPENVGEGLPAHAPAGESQADAYAQQRREKALEVLGNSPDVADLAKYFDVHVFDYEVKNRSGETRTIKGLASTAKEYGTLEALAYGGITSEIVAFRFPFSRRKQYGLLSFTPSRNGYPMVCEPLVVPLRPKVDEHSHPVYKENGKQEMVYDLPPLERTFYIDYKAGEVVGKEPSIRMGFQGMEEPTAEQKDQLMAAGLIEGSFKRFKKDGDTFNVVRFCHPGYPEMVVDYPCDALRNRINGFKGQGFLYDNGRRAAFTFGKPEMERWLENRPAEIQVDGQRALVRFDPFKGYFYRTETMDRKIDRLRAKEKAKVKELKAVLAERQERKAARSQSKAAAGEALDGPGRGQKIH